MLIDPEVTTQITVQRPVEDFGEQVSADLDPIEAVVSLSRPDIGSGHRFTQGGTLFVHRDADVRPGDQFTYQGNVFRVSGWPRQDQDQPFTGDDLGWKSYSIEGAG